MDSVSNDTDINETTENSMDAKMSFEVEGISPQDYMGGIAKLTIDYVKG